MTDHELAAQAEAFFRKTTLPYKDWIARARLDSSYAAKTNWGKGFAALDKIGATPVTPPPPPSGALEPYRSIIFAAQNPLDALGAPAYYRVAFTADPAYDQYATREAADRLRAAGHEVCVWYVPTEVSRVRADEVVVRLGVTESIGQCETADQFDASVAHGRKAMVGNLGALRPDQLAKVASGERIVVNETYYGCQPGLQPDWHNANKGVAGNCIAVYQDGDCRRIPLAEQVANGWFVPHRDSAYGPGFQAEDWATLRQTG